MIGRLHRSARMPGATAAARSGKPDKSPVPRQK